MNGYSSLSETVIIFTWVALLSCHVCTSIRSGVLAICRQGVLNALAWARDSMLSLRRGPKLKSTNPFDEEVLRLIHERQSKHMMSCCSIMGHAISIFVLGSVVNSFIGVPRWMTFGQDVSIAAMFLVNIIMNAWLDFQKQTTVLLAYLAYMVFTASFVLLGNVSLESPGEVVLYTGLCSFVVRLVATVNVLDFGASACLNFICSVLDCYKFLVFTGAGAFSTSNFLVCEILLFLIVMMLSEVIRTATCAEIFQRVTATAGSIEKSAVRTLLENMCDVILPLEPSLTLSEDVPQFKGMLMLEPNQSVRGVPLERYMVSDDDKERFQHQLTTSRPSSVCPESVVRCFNVALRDSDGNSISVEFFSVVFESLNKETHYILGIRELSDSRFAPLQGNLASGVTSDDLVNAQLNQARMACVSESLASSSVPSRASSRGRPRRILPHLRETSESAKIATLIHLIGSWNVQLQRTSCCSMHAGWSDVKSTLKRIQKLPCMRNLHIRTMQSCRTCGVLDCFDHEASCRACGGKGPIRL
eukprot:TRINITY_DN18584_c0_g2_i1.p1 TRINITY_DN18584_c0_g2~~TRINITY_DN18584_c0_g2_i1.p1  ORF type:complete len:530 (-),score=64.95 TRINITY_DN18584_c0_g2_i1:79-1668(-)